MKQIAALFSLILLVGCGKGGGGGASSTSVEGTDYSGTYEFSGVECYNSSLTQLTSVYLSAASSPTERLAISGNTASTTDTAAGCSTQEQSKVVFTRQGTEYGTFTVTSRSVTTSPGGSCTLNFSLTKNSGSDLTSTTFSATYSNNSNPAGLTGEYLRNTSTGAIGLLSSLKVNGSPSDLCFLIYLKQ